MSKAEEFRRAIPDILNSYASVEDLLARSDPGDGSLVRFYEQVSQQTAGQLISVVVTLTDALISPHRWSTLSRNPKEFNKRLEKVLSGIKKAMRAIHGVADHRPITQSVRDQRIIELHKANPKWSNGEIALRMGLPGKGLPNDANLVGSAITRATERDRRALRQFLELLAEALEFIECHQP